MAAAVTAQAAIPAGWNRELHREMRRELEELPGVYRLRALRACGDGLWLAWLELRGPEWPLHQVAVCCLHLALVRPVCSCGLEATARQAWEQCIDVMEAGVRPEAL